MSYHIASNTNFRELPEKIIVREDGYMSAYKDEGTPIVDYAYVPERTCKAIHDTHYHRGIHGYCEGRRCSNCNEPLFSEFEYCPWCGAKVVDA